MQSCIYEGRVTHHRYQPVDHEFGYSLFMVYLDLSELEQVTAGVGLRLGRSLAAASFDTRDHLHIQNGSLDYAVRETVFKHTGAKPIGPIRLLTQLRYLGQYFSPLNLFFCFDRSGNTVETIVAEVSNTPWGEQHCYVLSAENRIGGADVLRYKHKKSFHVSPFMDMDSEYEWRIASPGESLNVSIECQQRGRRFFDANLTLARRPLTRSSLRRSLVRYPAMTAQLLAAIYFEAFRLWRLKCPIYPYPDQGAMESRSAV